MNSVPEMLGYFEYGTPGVVPMMMRGETCSGSNRLLDKEDEIGDYFSDETLLEINESDLVKAEKIGKGSSGNVYRGTFKKSTMVAIKEERSSSKKAVKDDAEKMAKLLHRNVIKTIGVCVSRESFKPIMVVMELAEISLRKFLDELNFEMRLVDKLECLKQIAAGMKFLHSTGI